MSDGTSVRRLNLRPEKSQVIAALPRQPCSAVSAAATPATGASRAPSRVAFTLWGHPVLLSTLKSLIFSDDTRLNSDLFSDGERTPTPRLMRLASSVISLHRQQHTHTLFRWAKLLLGHFGYDESDLSHYE